MTQLDRPVRIPGGLAALVVGAASVATIAGGVVLAACGTFAGGGHLHVAAHLDVDIGNGGYAAMDEVPVTGGELRLVEAMPAPADQPGPARIAFPLRHTEVHARVAGPAATYTVEQVFDNPFAEPIEAVYVFPLGDEAAVSSYRIVIGDRVVAGEIQEREAARRTYQQARAAGHTAALLEQDKPNVFVQRIANIAPGESIRVRFEYSELLDIADGQYQLVFPLVVGPRYLPAGDVGRRPIDSHRAGAVARTGVTSVPYIEPTVAASTVGFTADVDGAVPVSGVESPSHDLDVDVLSPTRTRITLLHRDELPNRDLIVRYRATADQTAIGVLGHRIDGDGSFVLVVQPKADYRTGDVRAREVIVLIDRSGSMEGVPLAQARDVARAIVGTLTDRDTFNIISFSDDVEAMANLPVAGGERGRARGRAYIDAVDAGGGTEMGRGLFRALETTPGGDRMRVVYLLSDGFVGNDDVILSAVRGELGHNRIYPVGIGSAPNRYLLDQLGHVGRGFASYLGTTEKAADLTPTLVRRSAYPYLTDVRIDWNGLDVHDLTPAVVPDVHAGLPLIVAGRYRKPGRATVMVSATVAGQRVAIPVAVTLPVRADLPAVEFVWARRRIDELMAEARDGTVPAAIERQVTELGLRHHLVTEFTSFVAVDRTRVVAPGGAVRVVEQPALAPEGVNLDSAIGDAGYPAPDPPAYSGGGHSSGGGGGDRGGGGGGGWGGGAVDWVTLLWALALVPLARGLRRARARRDGHDDRAGGGRAGAA